MIFFEKKFLVLWKYVQMHQSTFLTTPDGQIYLFQNIFLVVWKYAKMHQNTFLTTSDVQKHLFWKKVSGGLEVCANRSKHVFNHFRRSKISFLKKSFWWSGSMRLMPQNTFWTTPDVQKYIFSEHFSCGLEVLYAKMHQNAFLTTTDLKKSF
jgi:hypothetical protein